MLDKETSMVLLKIAHIAFSISWVKGRQFDQELKTNIAVNK